MDNNVILRQWKLTEGAGFAAPGVQGAKVRRCQHVSSLFDFHQPGHLVGL